MIFEKLKSYFDVPNDSIIKDSSRPIFNAYQPLFDKVCKEFALNLHSIHGIKHWERVYLNTQILAKTYNITSEVFILFALLHDSQRHNEYADEQHGLRAASSIKYLIQDRLITLNFRDEARLYYTCANHTYADNTDPLYNDIIVQICLDADKLDIGRVGVIPHESHFLTVTAKEIVNFLSKNYYDNS